MVDRGGRQKDPRKKGSKYKQQKMTITSGKRKNINNKRVDKKSNDFYEARYVFHVGSN